MPESQPDPITKQVIENIRAARRALGWTAAKLAEEYAKVAADQEPPAQPMSRETIAKVEAGWRDELAVSEMYLLAAALGLPPSELLPDLTDVVKGAQAQKLREIIAAEEAQRLKELQEKRAALEKAAALTNELTTLRTLHAQRSQAALGQVATLAEQLDTLRIGMNEAQQKVGEVQAVLGLEPETTPPAGPPAAPAE